MRFLDFAQVTSYFLILLEFSNNQLTYKSNMSHFLYPLALLTFQKLVKLRI
jgi:hypothetical protein